MTTSADRSLCWHSEIPAYVARDATSGLCVVCAQTRYEAGLPIGSRAAALLGVRPTAPRTRPAHHRWTGV